MTVFATTATLRIAVVMALAITMASAQAHALDAGVKIACASDYFAHCSQHPVGSPGVRQCMRSAGAKLSGRCVKALVSAGEVAQREVDRKSASLR
jgi:hypothetical protein